MKNYTFKSLLALILISFTACSQNNKTVKETKTKETEIKTKKKINTEPHRYGGWYCPDNLRGFPPVDIANWKNVPVINGRMATKEETNSEASLIFVDSEKYPNAKALDISMPKLASFYNESTKRKELIIVIQAINVGYDSIVGFRYLNGGNGSARLHEVKFLSEKDIKVLQTSKFVSLNIKIDASEDVVWDVLTNSKYSKSMQDFFDNENKLQKDWRESSNINFHYSNSGNITAAFADKHFGAFYVQNDYDRINYSEKLFLFSNQETKICTLQIVFGPFIEDYETQKSIIMEWSKEVKTKSEKIKMLKLPSFEY